MQNEELKEIVGFLKGAQWMIAEARLGKRKKVELVDQFQEVINKIKKIDKKICIPLDHIKDSP